MTGYSQIQTEQALRKLTRLAKSGQVSDSLARNIQKLLGAEINQLEMDLAATEKDLGEFEQEFHLSTADFFRQWQAGQTDDRMDYVEWASLAQMAENLRKRLEFLSGENPK
jgi:uncharacterized damage-inducible protein DinB